MHIALIYRATVCVCVCVCVSQPFIVPTWNDFVRKANNGGSCHNSIRSALSVISQSGRCSVSKYCTIQTHLVPLLAWWWDGVPEAHWIEDVCMSQGAAGWNDADESNVWRERVVKSKVVFGKSLVTCTLHLCLLISLTVRVDLDL